MRNKNKWILSIFLFCLGSYQIFKYCHFNPTYQKLEIGVWYYAIPEKPYNPFDKMEDTVFVKVIERRGEWVRYIERGIECCPFELEEDLLISITLKRKPIKEIK